MKSRKPRSAFCGQLLAYSTAAGAAVAVPSLADAQAITNLTVDKFTGALTASGAPSTTGSFQVGANNISLTLNTGHYGYGWSSWNGRVVGNGVEFSGPAGGVTRLAFGDALAGFGNSNGFLARVFRRNPTGSAGDFAPTAASWKSGYIGFEAGEYKGWVGVAVHRGNNLLDGIKFIDPNSDGIYGAFSAGALTVGEVGVSAVPEPASVAAGLGLFALGAAGIREHRRRKLKAA